MLAAPQILAVIVVALAMVPALAHALEMPGKMRLGSDAYFAVQRIYYPGFTIAGVGEPAGFIAVGVLLLVTPRETSAFWLAFAALLGLAGMQAIYWIFIHPVNKVWVRGESVDRVGARFFSLGRSSADTRGTLDWTVLRNRWEYAHVARAVLAAASFILLVIAGFLESPPGS